MHDLLEDLDEVEELDDDVLDDDVLEVEPEPLEEEEAAAPSNGFHAFLRHANLHNLLQIESLSRTTGVFLVVSGGSRGYLHLAHGELVHAETGSASGEAAAAEILSWEDGEFKSCSRTLAPVRTVHSSVQTLLMRLAKASDDAARYHPELASRRHQSSRVVRRPLDQEAPTETYLPAVPASSGPSGAGSSASTGGVSSPGSVPPPSRSVASTASVSGAVPEAASALPSIPPPSAAPPPSLRPERGNNLAEVVISAAGEVMESRGAATEEFAARVAYATRLADLIGRAIRSGTPRGLELRGKSTQTLVQWQGDGSLSASLEQVPPARR